MKKILFICCKQRYLCKNRTYLDIVEKIKKRSKYNITIIFTNDNYSEKDFKKLNPDLTIFFEIDKIRSGDKFNFVFKKPVYVLSLDLFYLNDCINCPYIKKCKGIFTFSASSNILNNYKRIFPEKKIGFIGERSINTNIYTNYNLKKKYDILFYGSRDIKTLMENHDADKKYKELWEKYNKKKLENKHYFYPLRVKLYNILSKYKHKYNIKFLEDCGSLKAQKMVNEKLSQLINESHITVASSSRADILMAKYIEIAGSYSAILGNIPTDYRNVLENNIIEVTEWMSENEIINRIDRALNNKKELWRMTRRMGDFVHKNYNINTNVKFFDEIIKI